MRLRRLLFPHAEAEGAEQLRNEQEAQARKAVHEAAARVHFIELSEQMLRDAARLRAQDRQEREREPEAGHPDGDHYRHS